MKIGIIGATDRCGKTTLMFALGHCFALSQKKRVCMFSTSSLVHVLKELIDKKKDKDASTIGLFEAMLKTGYVQGEGMYDYAIRTSKANTYVFDVFESSRKSDESYSFLVHSIEMLDSDLTLIEINGDPMSKSNSEVLKTCQVIIYVFNQDNYSISKLVEYKKELTPRLYDRHCFICDSYEDTIMSEKKLSALTGLPQKELQVLSYNPALQKMLLEYDLVNMTDGLCYGNPELLPLRQQLCSIMQYIFDDEKYKRIVLVKDWPKNPMGIYK